MSNYYWYIDPNQIFKYMLDENITVINVQDRNSLVSCNTNSSVRKKSQYSRRENNISSIVSLNLNDTATANNTSKKYLSRRENNSSSIVSLNMNNKLLTNNPPINLDRKISKVIPLENADVSKEETMAISKNINETNVENKIQNFISLQSFFTTIKQYITRKYSDARKLMKTIFFKSVITYFFCCM